MHGVRWTPGIELAASLEARIHHAMLDPGEQVPLTLAALYRAMAAEDATLTAALFLVGSENRSEEVVLARRARVDTVRLQRAHRDTLRRSWNYQLEVRLDFESGEVPTALQGVFRKSLPVHIEPALREIHRLHSRLGALRGSQSGAVPLAEYVLILY